MRFVVSNASNAHRCPQCPDFLAIQNALQCRILLHKQTGYLLLLPPRSLTAATSQVRLLFPRPVSFLFSGSSGYVQPRAVFAFLLSSTV